MRRLQIQAKKNSGQFRMLRCLSIDYNIRRLAKHARRLARKLHSDRGISIARLKSNRASRARPHLASITGP